MIDVWECYRPSWLGGCPSFLAVAGAASCVSFGPNLERGESQIFIHYLKKYIGSCVVNSFEL
jgi:hypothetical protein